MKSEEMSFLSEESIEKLTEIFGGHRIWIPDFDRYLDNAGYSEDEKKQIRKEISTTE